MSRKDNRKDDALHEQTVEDLQSVMRTVEGRRFIWNMLRRCGIYRNSFTGNSETFFLEGERNIGLWALSMIHQNCSDLYLIAQREAMEYDEKMRNEKVTAITEIEDGDNNVG